MSNPFAPDLARALSGYAPFGGDPGFEVAAPPFGGDRDFEVGMPPAAAPTNAPATPFDVPAVATPPIVALRPPQMPPFTVNQPPAHGAPNFLSMALPVIAAALMGRKDPRAVAAGLAGFMRGQDLKRAERETLQQRDERRQQEQAEFYGRAITQAQTFDDPVVFEQWKAAIGPVAQVHGIDPNVFTFNDQKRLGREKKEAAELLDVLDKQHPDGNYTAQWKGRRVTRAELASFAGRSAFDADGAPLPPAGNFKASTPDDMKIAAFARARGKRVEDLTADEIAQAQAVGKPAKDNAPNAGSFEDYMIRYAKQLGKDPAALTPADIEAARKAYNQSDDKASAGPRARYSVQQITLPDGNTGLLRVNMETGEATPVTLPEGAGAGKASDTQRLSKAYLDRTTASDATARDFEKGLAGIGAQLDVKLPNLLKTEQGQRYRQAKDEFINASLRRESGAAIADTEYDRFDKIYFVQPGDTDATIKQKQDARQRVVAGFRVTAGNMGATPKKAGPAIGERRMINGALGEWDGKGWKPVAGK